MNGKNIVLAKLLIIALTRLDKVSAVVVTLLFGDVIGSVGGGGGGVIDQEAAVVRARAEVK